MVQYMCVHQQLQFLVSLMHGIFPKSLWCKTNTVPIFVAPDTHFDNLSLFSGTQAEKDTLWWLPKKITVSTCGDSRCGTCPFLKTGSCITFKCGKSFSVNDNMSCKSKNLLYCITCNVCGNEYIGQAGTQLPARIRVHR
jgi:hypothetical protein